MAWGLIVTAYKNNVSNIIVGSTKFEIILIIIVQSITKWVGLKVRSSSKEERQSESYLPPARADCLSISHLPLNPFLTRLSFQFHTSEQ